MKNYEKNYEWKHKLEKLEKITEITKIKLIKLNFVHLGKGVDNPSNYPH